MHLSLSLSLLVVLLLAAGAIAQTPDENVVLVDRKTVEGKTISDRFCAMDSSGTCHWEDYVSFLILVIVPFVVLAILAVICGPVLGLLRLVGCMGGRKPRRGLCCGKGKKTKLYSVNVVYTIKALAALALFASLCCFIIAYVGNARVSSGVSGMWDALIRAGDTLTERVVRIGDLLEALPFTQDAQGATDEAASAASSFSADMQDTKDIAVEYEVIRSSAANISLLVPFILLFLAVVLGFFNKRGCCVHIWLAVIILLVLSLVWVSTAIHSLFAVVFDDSCDEFRDLIDGSSNDNLIDTLVSCSSADGISAGFTGFLDDARSGLQQAEEEACNTLTPQCLIGASPKLDNCPAEACSQDTLSMYLMATWAPNANTGGNVLTVSECVDQCAVSDERARSIAASVSANNTQAYDSLINDEILPLLSCDFLNDLVRDLFESFCSELTSGLILVARAQIAMAVFLGLSCIFLWLGQKRFIPKSECKDGSRGKEKDYENVDEKDVALKSAAPAPSKDQYSSYEF